MRKKILFVTSTLDCDGAAKSLVSLLTAFDYRYYDVYLLVCNSRSVFFRSSIPKNVIVLETPPEVDGVFMPLGRSLKRLLGLGNLSLVIARLGLSLSVRHSQTQ
jgi:hypothetical protein